MDLACPKELATEILSDYDQYTKVAPTTLNQIGTPEFGNSTLAIYGVGMQASFIFLGCNMWVYFTCSL